MEDEVVINISKVEHLKEKASDHIQEQLDFLQWSKGGRGSRTEWLGLPFKVSSERLKGIG